MSDFDEAIEEANNTEYGLEAGLFTQDIDRASYGRVVNIGAIQSCSPLPGAAAYAVSKAGLEGLTKSLAVEWSDPASL